MFHLNTLKFMLDACIDTLPTPANVRGWKKTTYVITIPYADDFCLITSDLRTHRRIINKFQKSFCSMGIKLKLNKYRYLAILYGISSQFSFYIGDNQIPCIYDEEQKFLAKLLFFFSKSLNRHNHIHNTLKAPLENIEESLSRSEYKLWIFKHYLVHSKLSSLLCTLSLIWMLWTLLCTNNQKRGQVCLPVQLMQVFI